MTFSKFEKYAASKINNHTSEVDAEALWNDVLPHVQKGKNRRRGFIWFFFTGLIVSLSAVYVYSDNNDSDVENEATALSAVNSLNEVSFSKPSDSKGNKLDLATISEKPNEKNIQIFNKKATEKTAVKNDPLSKKTQKKNSFSQIVQKQFEAPKTIESSPIIYKTEPEIIPEIEKIDPVIVPAKEETKNNADQNLENAATTSNETEDTRIEAEIFSIIESQENTKETEKEDGTNEDGTNEGEEDGGGSFNNKFKLKYGFGFYGGISSSFVSLKDKTDLNSEYLQTRLKNEEQLETIRMGFEAIAQTEFGVYLKTGVQYSKIARKFSLNSTIESIDSVYGIQKIYVNNNTNDTIYVYGQVPVTTVTDYNKTTYNYFHLMDIPVLAGYTYKNENWSFGVEAGALINISTKTKGVIMDLDGGFYDIKEDKLDWFKESVGVSFTAAVNIGYHFDNFQIYLAPTARLESVFSTDANPIEQKHGALGVNIGARYFIGD